MPDKEERKNLNIDAMNHIMRCVSFEWSQINMILYQCIHYFLFVKPNLEAIVDCKMLE